MHLVLAPDHAYHVSLDTVREFEQAILSSSGNGRIDAVSPNRISSELSFLALRILRRVPFHPASWPFPDRKSQRRERQYFSILMGCSFKPCLPYFFFPGHKSAYFFDAWPSTHENLIYFTSRLGIQDAFVSSRAAAEMLSAYGSGCQFHWIPEGISPEAYVFRPYDRKDIDVMQFGRKYDWYHNKICSSLNEHGKTYLYEKQKGEILFPTRRSFIEGLARSKISICFPSSITHPERSGDVETMTVRYLQSMASKCLILGKAPREMVDIFGYNPVIDIDVDYPGDQIISILERYDDYLYLIERNYNKIFKNTWASRWREITEIILSNGS